MADDHRLDVAPAVYGSIIATAFVAAVAQKDDAARDLALSLLATMVVFWIAHVWAKMTGERVRLRTALSGGQVRAMARREWPMVEAGLGPVIALALAWAGVYADDTGVALALGLGVVQLFAWGFVAGRRIYGRLGPALLSAAVDGSLGLAIVALEAALH
jgi:hypothetical protein